jgi:hypothetical protein
MDWDNVRGEKPRAGEQVPRPGTHRTRESRMWLAPTISDPHA